MRRRRRRVPAGTFYAVRLGFYWLMPLTSAKSPRLVGGPSERRGLFRWKVDAVDLARRARARGWQDVGVVAVRRYRWVLR